VCLRLLDSPGVREKPNQRQATTRFREGILGGARLDGRQDAAVGDSDPEPVALARDDDADVSGSV
jgi:hypothetical protein